MNATNIYGRVCDTRISGRGEYLNSVRLAAYASVTRYTYV